MKTLAIRLEDEQHARLTILAKLSEVSVTDAIRHAIEAHIAKLAADPTISARAEALRAEIDREAAEQRAALAGLLGTETPPADPATPNTRARKS